MIFYRSKDLKTWTETSRFGPAGAPGKSNWECPDLFELPVEGSDGEKLWVLEADMGNGSIAGGSGGEYFVGRFDGREFKALQDARWVDYGRDFYAPISWSDIPADDGRRIWLGWFNNWQTCLVPTHPWRSCMSVPRTLSLRRVDPEPEAKLPTYVLVQRPVRELERIHGEKLRTLIVKASWPPKAMTEPGDLTDMSFRLQCNLKPGTARSVGLRLRTGDGEYTEIGYDSKGGVTYVDRRRSGNVEFHAAFAGRHEAPTHIRKGKVALDIIVDRSSVEVFINDGESVISDRIFPSSRKPVIEVFAGDGSASVEDTIITKLRSIWNHSE